MGFYIEARNKKNEVFAKKSFQVWNPNVEHLYVPLGLANPYGEDFSGRGEEITVSYQTLQQAYKEVEGPTFYSEAKRELLHPAVLIFSGLHPMQLDADREKEMLLRFLSCCIETAEKEGIITLYLG
ncbi:MULTISPECIES: hypothetical protein [Mesobacillus]|uniref:Uncharacterized protein n=2 Tax=Mesobacillus TaxID=2675231 RepID=A0A0D6ZB35_9BACI|nr:MULTISPECIES: hypothetical protein [Mesobacillus]KIY22555.1 hypothetical protein UB32_07745 [Mesobacillus subterraneus]MDQ0415000.1 hypothetical protein [Mesobacillus stamsii]